MLFGTWVFQEPVNLASLKLTVQRSVTPGDLPLHEFSGQLLQACLAQPFPNTLDLSSLFQEKAFSLYLGFQPHGRFTGFWARLLKAWDTVIRICAALFSLLPEKHPYFCTRMSPNAMLEGFISPTRFHQVVHKDHVLVLPDTQQPFPNQTQLLPDRKTRLLEKKVSAHNHLIVLQCTYWSWCRGCPSHWKPIQVFPLNWVHLLLGPCGVFQSQTDEFTTWPEWLEKSACLTGRQRGVQTQKVSGLVFWALGKPKEPSHQSKGRGDTRTLSTSANQNQLPALSSTKKDVVCKDVPPLGDPAKGKNAFHGSFTEHGVEMLSPPMRTR